MTIRQRRPQRWVLPPSDGKARSGGTSSGGAPAGLTAARMAPPRPAGPATAGTLTAAASPATGTAAWVAQIYCDYRTVLLFITVSVYSLR
jgi:hypothetical protein